MTKKFEIELLAVAINNNKSNEDLKLFQQHHIPTLVGSKEIPFLKNGQLLEIAL